MVSASTSGYRQAIASGFSAADSHYRFDSCRIDHVGFVEDEQPRNLIETQFAQNSIHGSNLLLAARIRGVDQVNQQATAGDLFECGSEGGEQIRR